MKDFAAIDFETANYNRTSICSIGIVVVRDGEIKQSIYRLVKPLPNYYIRRFSEEIHGIYYNDTCNAPDFSEVWNEIFPLVGDIPFVAHNKAFDETVLRATLEAYGIRFPEHPFYCTLQTARKKIPRAAIENYRLPTVCRYLGIDFTLHHHALADAEGCARIAMQLL
ncbi:3'-5' exonuclease [Coprobacter tertius]|uniref:3'-5' exonuclease n=1 Tax=Coprobacter tertius TaxID=2944915 RepID=A0ABT1MJ14_9BACT|nr:3'-5' exonuclease [Coprobacter tertius]MCP9612610.1 3'-5' exonuclease [Coprobacter tertius]